MNKASVSPRHSWSSMARWAWLALIVLALASRLLGLPAIPLGPGEAARAVSALDVTRGDGWPASADSPLLLVCNVALFLLFGAGDGIARLLPALAGAALVVLPWLWRKHIGDIGALTAGILLLVSPLNAFAARQVHPAALGGLSAALLATLALHVVLGQDGPAEEPLKANLHDLLVACGVGLGLVSGPAFYDLLLAGAVAWAAFGRRGTHRNVAQRWQRPSLVGLGIAMLVSIALGFRWSGWAGIADSAAAWLGGWRSGDSAHQVGLVLLYEPLLLVLLVAGIAMLVVNGRHGGSDPAALRTLRALGLWGLIAILLNTVRRGSTPESWGLVVLPLALLAGHTVEVLFREASSRSMKQMGLHTVTAFIAWIPVLLGGAQYARGSTGADWVFLMILGTIVVVALQGLMIYIFSVFIPPRDAWRGAVLGLVGAVLVLQATFASGLAYTRATSPVEPAIVTGPSPDLRHLRETLHEIMVTRGQRRDSLPIVLIDQNSEITTLVLWTLRDFGALEVTQGWPGDANVLVISPEAVAVDERVEASAWRGMRFVASTRYGAPVPACETLLPPQCSQALAWYLYRTSPYPITPNNLILWQADDATGR